MNRAFNRMWYAQIASAFADGLVITATPLLGVRLTSDPFLISLLSAMSYLPWLLLAVGAGVVVDRANRRLVLAIANLARFAAIGALAAVVGFGRPEIWLLLVCSFVMGGAETLSDSASVALMPTLAGPGQLDRANARIQGAQVVVRQFLAAPAAAWLFGAIAALPFVIGAASYGAASLLALAIPAAALKVATARPRAKAAPDDAWTAGQASPAKAGAPAVAVSEPGSARLGEAVEDVQGEGGALAGLRFLWHHPRLRPLWLLATASAAGNSFAQATVVLYVLGVLHVPERAYGLAVACTAIGGLLGAVTARPLSARFGRGTALLGALVAGALATISVGLATTAWVGVAGWSLSAWGSGIWNVLSMSARQQLMPPQLMGRIHGVWRTVMWGIIPVAAALGGLASRWSLHSAWLIGGGICLISTLAFTRAILSFNRTDAPDILQR